MAPATSLLGSSDLTRALVAGPAPSARRLLEVSAVTREHVLMMQSDIADALLMG
jgi:hypothetical protein